jgi:hypothetical protein
MIGLEENYPSGKNILYGIKHVFVSNVWLGPIFISYDWIAAFIISKYIQIHFCCSWSCYTNPSHLIDFSVISYHDYTTAKMALLVSQEIWQKN